MKDRLFKLGFAALVALAVPTVATLARGVADAATGSSAAAQALTAPAASNAPAARAHNHGWFVSQAAKNHSTTGKAHGAAVSKIAQGAQGKPVAANH